jgi:hypothetical protein
MFKVYCHMSFLIQCYIYYNPKTLLLIKKRDICFRPRAREDQEYSFALLNYTLVPTPTPLNPTLFVLLYAGLGLRPIYS